MRVTLGIERLLDSGRLDGRRVAVVCNPSSVDGQLRHVVDRIAAHSRARLTAIFGPQHGFRSDVQENMIESGHAHDDVRRVPVYSLYSDVRGATKLYPRSLRFTEGSFLYNMERAEFVRVSQSRTGRHFRITSATTRTDFLALFEKITGSPLSEEQFHELESKFHAFRAEFSEVAELGS